MARCGATPNRLTTFARFTCDSSSIADSIAAESSTPPVTRRRARAVPPVARPYLATGGTTSANASATSTLAAATASADDGSAARSRSVRRSEPRSTDRTQPGPWSLVPTTSCVEPLAAARGLAVEEDEALTEGSDSAAALAALRAVGEPVVACVHGDLCAELLGERTRKGSTPILELENDSVAVLEQLEPPA